jgi:hypothetical protein
MVKTLPPDVMSLTIKQAKRIGLTALNWSQKLSLASKYAGNRLYYPKKFSLTAKSPLGGVRNLDRIVEDILHSMFKVLR